MTPSFTGSSAPASGVSLMTSIAPSAARIPQRIDPPSKAGPAGAAVEIDALAVGQHDLAVRADVDEEPGPLVAVHARGEHARDDVAVYIGAQRREEDRACTRVQAEADLGDRHVGQIGARHDERRRTSSGSGSTPSSSATIVALSARATS